MADITDPYAVRFCNEQIRPNSDKAAQYYYDSKGVVNEWFSNDLASLIPNDDSPIIDGSEIDGRPPITGADVTNIVSRALDYITDLEANDNAKLNTILAVSVNPQHGV